MLEQDSMQNCKHIYREEYIRRIHKVQDYIDTHYGQSMTIDELANVAGFSKYHFSRIFQSILHEPLAHYVNRIRMENSIFLLAHRKDMNMTDIAFELGFTDSAVFSRAFKNYFGTSPREYRNEYSKNCKDSFLLSDYNIDTAKKEKNEKKEWADNPYRVTGQISIINMKEKQIVYVRHTGTYKTLAKEYANMVQLLFESVDKQNLLDGQNWVLAIYHDNPEFGDESQFRTSLCISVPDNKRVIEDGILGVMKLEAGLYAVGHFELRPEQFEDAWNYMYHEWIMGSGYVPRNYYPFELYLNDPNTNEDHISVVDIYLPIEPIIF